jgi:hypothetical protein
VLEQGKPGQRVFREVDQAVRHLQGRGQGTGVPQNAGGGGPLPDAEESGQGHDVEKIFAFQEADQGKSFLVGLPVNDLIDVGAAGPSWSG